MDAVELYRGELLAGFHVAGAAPEFATWLDTMRATYARRYESALQSIAGEREAAGDRAAAVVWRRRVAAHDPLNSDAALQLMRALAAAGDPGAAIRHARVHETLLREELDAPPDERITQFVKTLQAPPNGNASAARPPALPAPVSAAESAATERSNQEQPASPPSPSGSGGFATRNGETPPRSLALRRCAALGWRSRCQYIRLRAQRAPDLTSSLRRCRPARKLLRRSHAGRSSGRGHRCLITELARYQRLSVISRTQFAIQRNYKSR